MVGAGIAAGIAYRIAEENAKNEISDLKMKLAKISSSSAAALTDASLSSRIQTIEEYIDSIRGVHKLVIYPKYNKGFFLPAIHGSEQVLLLFNFISPRPGSNK